MRFGQGGRLRVGPFPSLPFPSLTGGCVMVNSGALRNRLASRVWLVVAVVCIFPDESLVAFSALDDECGGWLCGVPVLDCCTPPTDSCVCDDVCTPHYITYEDYVRYESSEVEQNTCLQMTPISCGTRYNCIPIASASSCGSNSGCIHSGGPIPLWAIRYSESETNCTPDPA